MRYLITFAYRGTNYHGWQVQPNGVTVQQLLDEAISTLTREEIHSIGAGRTDAGVHAKMMTAHFDTEKEIKDIDNFAYKINKILPEDIAVFKLEDVADDFSARFSATSRTYRYYITTKKDAFASDQMAYIALNFDIDKMNDAAQILLETEDFTSFSKVNTDTKTNICNVTKAEWTSPCEGKLIFEITANRFLRNMVRAIVGTLLDVGRNKITKEDFRRIIEKKDRCSASTSAPACGLYLEDITY
ncbi:MAG: tRNA pseudouridine(38-40) synthase TruA [Paludibacteraceae bacterium]|nr:tRNA pseudouridine(38-40) synthase TruA [Paludibacteraceae bacterium]